MYSMRDTGGQHLKENTEWTRGGGEYIPTQKMNDPSLPLVWLDMYSAVPSSHTCLHVTIILHYSIRSLYQFRENVGWRTPGLPFNGGGEALQVS